MIMKVTMMMITLLITTMMMMMIIITTKIIITPVPVQGLGVNVDQVVDNFVPQLPSQ